MTERFVDLRRPVATAVAVTAVIGAVVWHRSSAVALSLGGLRNFIFLDASFHILAGILLAIAVGAWWWLRDRPTGTLEGAGLIAMLAALALILVGYTAVLFIDAAPSLVIDIARFTSQPGLHVVFPLGAVAAGLATVRAGGISRPAGGVLLVIGLAGLLAIPGYAALQQPKTLSPFARAGLDAYSAAFTWGLALFGLLALRLRADEAAR